MKYQVVEGDNSYEDEYQLEDFEITVSEYLCPGQVEKTKIFAGEELQRLLGVIVFRVVPDVPAAV